MDVGKEVSNYYKLKFEFSNFISFLYLFCAYIIVWKKILKNLIPPPPPFWVFSLIIHSLCFINDEDCAVATVQSSLLQGGWRLCQTARHDATCRPFNPVDDLGLDMLVY